MTWLLLSIGIAALVGAYWGELLSSRPFPFHFLSRTPKGLRDLISKSKRGVYPSERKAALQDMVQYFPLHTATEEALLRALAKDESNWVKDYAREFLKRMGR